MKTRRMPVAALALVSVLGAAEAGAQARDWKEIKHPPLRAFTPPEPKRIALPNGMVVFLMEDHELPLVQGWARIRGGSRDEPAAKVGLVNLYGQVWRTGGTAARTGDQLDDELEARAARVETGGGLDSTTVSFNTLKGSLDEVFAVFVDLLKAPAFREDKLPLARNQVNTSIARRNDDASGVASREARRLGYGPDSPYARIAEYATVAAVTRDDLVQWHKTYVHPNNIVMGVVGDFDSAAMEKRLRAAFASWPRGPAAPKPVPATPEPKPGVYFVNRDDINQSNIRMVAAGIRRDNPDYFALEVLNEVFGGGFSARLFSNIRSRKGLAYSVGGGVGSSFDHPGLFTLSMGTKSETTAAAIDALYEEIDGILKTPATDEELKKAKEAILNSFVFRFDSRQEVVAEKVAYEFYGYPLDFLNRYRTAIEAVTTADVARVARKYIDRNKVAVLVVGKARDFDKPLSTYGAVTTLDVTIPGPGGAKPAAGTAPAPPGADAAGKALLARVVEGLGGAAKVAAVKAVRQKVTAKMRTPQGEMPIEIEALAVLPGTMRQQVQTPMGAMTSVITPDVAFITGPMGTRDLPPSQKESTLRELRNTPLYVAQHAADPKLSLRAGAKEKVGDVEAQVLEGSLEGTDFKWWVDPATGRVLKSVSQVTGMGGAPVEQVTEFSDFRTVDGMTVAFKRKMTRGGEDAGSAEITEYAINPAVDPKQFEKPAAPTP